MSQKVPICIFGFCTQEYLWSSAAITVGWPICSGPEPSLYSGFEARVWGNYLGIHVTLSWGSLNKGQACNDQRHRGSCISLSEDPLKDDYFCCPPSLPSINGGKVGAEEHLFSLWPSWSTKYGQPYQKLGECKLVLWWSLCTWDHSDEVPSHQLLQKDLSYMSMRFKPWNSTSSPCLDTII